MNVNSSKVWTYRFCYAHHRLIWTTWWLLLAAELAGYEALRRAREAASGAPWPSYLSYSSAALVGLLLVASGPLLVFSGLYGVRFRYVTLWTARAAGAIKRWLFTGWRSAFLLLAAVAFATWGFYRLSDKSYRASQLLTTPSLIKLVAIGLLVRIVLWAYKTSSRLVILPFTNYALGDTLKTSVEGIATRLFSELAGLAQLYSTIDDMTPKTGGGEEKIAQASVQVQDVGAVLQGAISGESKVKLGPVELPIGALIGVVGRIAQGPRITGSLHKDGNSMTLVASLTGGGRNRNWRVRSEDLDEGQSTEDSALRSIIEQMAYRIFTDLVDTGSTRWRAVRCHSQGLRFFRDQVKTKKDWELSLHQAEKAFIQALAEDKEFAQNYYNLGIVYREQGSHAAKAEFQQAIAANPRFMAAYYALAMESETYERMRLCKQVISLQPDYMEAWSLMGTLRRSTKDATKWEQVIESRAIAAALSWKVLCDAAWAGDSQDRPRTLAQRCLFDLAIAHARAGREAYSARVFRQALYSDPTDAQTYFELGKVLESVHEYREAASAYSAALCIQDEPTFWDRLANVQAALCENSENEGQKEKYRPDAMQVCSFLMDCPSLVDDPTLERLMKACDVPKEKESALKLHREDVHKQLELASRRYDEGRKRAEAQKRLEAARKFAEAQEHFEAAISKLNEREICEQDLYTELAKCYWDDDKLKKALENAKNAVELRPMGIGERRLLAGIYYALGDYERTESAWQICLDLEPGDRESLKGIADTYWERGTLIRCPKERRKAFTRVIEIFNQTLELSEDWVTQAGTHYWLGRFHADLRNYDKASCHFNVAKNMGFKPLETRVQLGLTYAEAKAFDEAEDAFCDALAKVEEYKKKGGKLEEKFDSVGVAHAEGDAESNAGEEYPVNEHLIQLYLGQAMAYAERAVNLKQALRLAEDVASLIPQVDKPTAETMLKSADYQSSLHDCRGWIYFRQGDIVKAVEELEEAVSLRVNGVFDDGSGYYHLAMAYLAQAQASRADSAKPLARAQQRCLDARQASVRGVYKQEILDLLAQLDSLKKG